MSITILSRPYDDLGPVLPKLNPVYNGLGFAVTSNKNKSANFKYVAEIFVNGGKVGQLSHNPDISNNNIGIFDIGRIVENFVSYNLNWNNTTLAKAPNSLVGYHVEFGEEFSRVGDVKSVQSGLGGLVRIETTVPHNLEDGSRVLIQGSLIEAYNGYKTIKYNSITSFLLIGSTFTSSNIGGNMYFLSGEPINQFLSYIGADGQNYVRIKTKGNTSFQIGNTINIQLDSTSWVSWLTNYQNMDWTIVKMTISTTYSYLDTNIPWQGSVPSTYTGSVVSRNNFFVRNSISTKNDKAMAFNGVEQYDTWLDWNPTPYMLTSATGKFLTKRPRKDISVCYTDYMVLSQFGRTNFTGSTTPDQTYYVVETWSVPPSPRGIVSIGNSAFGMYVVMDGLVQADWTAGSYIRIDGFYTSGPNKIAIYTECRIASTNTAAGQTIVSLINGDGTPPNWYNTSTGAFVFSGYDAAMYINIPANPWTITGIKKVKYNKVLALTDRNEGPAGPKNLSYAEINDKTCYKYFVYHVKYDPLTADQWWVWQKRSETFTFNIDCSCSKFKKYTLMWLNDLGGWDFYYFNLKSDIEREIERTQFHKHLKSYKSVGSTGYKYTQGERGRTTYNTTSIDSFTVRTNYLSREELEWMSNLMESPEVYWINNTKNLLGQDTDKIIPVNITNGSFDLFNKTNVNSDTGTLYIYEFTFQSALNRGVQRGGATSLPSGSSGPVVVNPTTPPNGPWLNKYGWSYADWKVQRDQFSSYTTSFYE